MPEFPLPSLEGWCSQTGVQHHVKCSGGPTELPALSTEGFGSPTCLQTAGAMQMPQIQSGHKWKLGSAGDVVGTWATTAHQDADKGTPTFEV